MTKLKEIPLICPCELKKILLKRIAIIYVITLIVNIIHIKINFLFIITNQLSSVKSEQIQFVKSKMAKHTLIDRYQNLQN